ncbi:MAG: PEP-CTERM sorting domain-containing protein [Planctomycetia bacterium]|nr:PEP-CTERM sorting domain-containing protein [Planctomycetia bacterium]
MKIKIWILCGGMLAGWWGMSASWGMVYTWNGFIGDWNEETNWAPIGVPGSGDTVFITGPHANVTGFSGNYDDLEINLHFLGTLTVSDDVKLSQDSFLDINISGSFHISQDGRFSVPVVDMYNGSYTQSGGIANIDKLSMKSANTRIVFCQERGEALTYRDDNGNLVGGITISDTADISQGTVSVDVFGIQFTNSNIAYTLIENGVSALPANVSSNVYDLRISDDDLVATLRTDLTSTGVFGAVKPTGNSLTLYTNLEGEDFDDLRSWLHACNLSLDFEKGAEPSSFLLSLTGMGDLDSLIWDLSRFDDNAMLSTTPFSPQPSVPVPEPATWLLLLLGTAFLLKRRMIR